MPCFVVAYDLNTVGQNYTCLTDKVKKLPHCHAQQSVWFVEYAGTEDQLRAHLSACLDTNDRLFVSQISKTWSGMNMPTCGKWLNDRGY